MSAENTTLLPLVIDEIERAKPQRCNCGSVNKATHCPREAIYRALEGDALACEKHRAEYAVVPGPGHAHQAGWICSPGSGPLEQLAGSARPLAKQVAGSDLGASAGDRPASAPGVCARSFSSNAFSWPSEYPLLAPATSRPWSGWSG